MTKHERGLYAQYQRATARNLFDVYARPSHAKRRAEEWNREQCYLLNGKGFKITSNNSQFFSCAFLYPDKDTAAIRLFYNTGRNIYDFEI